MTEHPYQWLLQHTGWGERIKAVFLCILFIVLLLLGNMFLLFQPEYISRKSTQILKKMLSAKVRLDGLKMDYLDITHIRSLEIQGENYSLTLQGIQIAQNPYLAFLGVSVPQKIKIRKLLFTFRGKKFRFSSSKSLDFWKKGRWFHKIEIQKAYFFHQGKILLGEGSFYIPHLTLEFSPEGYTVEGIYHRLYEKKKSHEYPWDGLKLQGRYLALKDLWEWKFFLQNFWISPKSQKYVSPRYASFFSELEGYGELSLHLLCRKGKNHWQGKFEGYNLSFSSHPEVFEKGELHVLFQGNQYQIRHLSGLSHKGFFLWKGKVEEKTFTWEVEGEYHFPKKKKISINTPSLNQALKRLIQEIKD
ncbi:MAG: hypothetical protein D6785_11010 [Planctomycetota bacterium]|nr:MAG: hypothetical protein D6785_11010 [Planctomycetota bacterium]